MLDGWIFSKHFRSGVWWIRKYTLDRMPQAHAFTPTGSFSLPVYLLEHFWKDGGNLRRNMENMRNQTQALAQALN